MSTDSVWPPPFPCGEGRFSNAVLVPVHHCDELECDRPFGHGVARAPRPQAPRAPRTEVDWLLVCTVRPAWLIIPGQDDFYHLMNGRFCGEAWDAVSRYVYTALQGGAIMKGWTNDDRIMIACCNDGTRPVIFKIERIDIPENDEEREWLAKQNFRNTAEDAYTG